jgi:hypothetical protein
LATLPGHKGDPIQLTLHSAFAALPDKSQLIGQADAEGDALTIQYIPADTAMEKSPVATVRRDGTDLKFQWADSAVDSSIRRQLRNCVISVSLGGRSRKMQLREPVAASPMILDLYDNNKDFEFQIEDLPKASPMRLKSLSLDDFPSGTVIRAGAKELEYNKSVFIDFVEMKGAQVRLRLLQQPKTKALFIRAEPTIKESASREYEMTMTGFDKLEAGQRKQLAESQIRVTQLTRALRDAQDSLDWLMLNKPSNPAQFAPWNTRVTAARADIGSMPGKIARANGQIVEAQARLSAIPDVRNFMNSLHKRATVHFALCATDGDAELVLIANPLQ